MFALIEGESQSLLRMCGICLLVSLTQKNAWNAIDICSIYGNMAPMKSTTLWVGFRI